MEFAEVPGTAPNPSTQNLRLASGSRTLKCKCPMATPASLRAGSCARALPDSTVANKIVRMYGSAFRFRLRFVRGNVVIGFRREYRFGVRRAQVEALPAGTAPVRSTREGFQQKIQH